jgi:hypothetical protein
MPRRGGPDRLHRLPVAGRPRDKPWKERRRSLWEAKAVNRQQAAAEGDGTSDPIRDAPS